MGAEGGGGGEWWKVGEVKPLSVELDLESSRGVGEPRRARIWERIKGLGPVRLLVVVGEKVDWEGECWDGFSTASKAALRSKLVVPVDLVFPERAEQTIATL